MFWIIFSVFKKKWVLGNSWTTLLWHWCYYTHRARDALSPVCGIFFSRENSLLCCGPILDITLIIFFLYIFFYIKRSLTTLGTRRKISQVWHVTWPKMRLSNGKLTISQFNCWMSTAGFVMDMCGRWTGGWKRINSFQTARPVTPQFMTFSDSDSDSDRDSHTTIYDF